MGGDNDEYVTFTCLDCGRKISCTREDAARHFEEMLCLVCKNRRRPRRDPFFRQKPDTRSYWRALWHYSYLGAGTAVIGFIGGLIGFLAAWIVGGLGATAFDLVMPEIGAWTWWDSWHEWVKRAGFVIGAIIGLGGAYDLLEDLWYMTRGSR